MNNFHRFQNFRQFSNLFSKIWLKKRHTSLFSEICRETRTKFHKKIAEKYKIRIFCDWINEYSLTHSQTLRILRFLARIFDEFFSGFRAKFQKIVTCVAFSIKFAKTNQKVAENSEFCGKNSLLVWIIHFTPRSGCPGRGWCTGRGGRGGAGRGGGGRARARRGRRDRRRAQGRGRQAAGPPRRLRGRGGRARWKSNGKLNVRVLSKWKLNVFQIEFWKSNVLLSCAFVLQWWPRLE